MRFYEIDAGTMTLDGIDYRDLTRDQVRRCFGMVLQDTWLFAGTIRDNIGYGKQGATAGEIVAAARAAYADHFIRTLPDGYDTLLDEDASNLSAGQKQLLAIARAFLASPRHPHPRRGDQQRRHPHRDPHPGGDVPAAAGQDQLRHRPPAVYHPQRGHDHRDGRRAASSSRAATPTCSAAAASTSPSTTASSPRTSPRQADGARGGIAGSVTATGHREPTPPCPPPGGAGSGTKVQTPRR